MAEQAGGGLRLPPVLLRVVSAVVIGAASFLVVKVSGGSLEATVILSVFLGGVVLVVGFLVGVEAGQSRLAEEQRATLATLTRATRLEDSIRKSPVTLDETARLVENMTVIADLGPGVVSDLLRAEFERFAQFAEQMRGGEANYAGEDRDWLLVLTRSAQVEILATSSLLVDDGFWSSELGEQYLEAQGTVAGRGVPVRRIFVVDGEARMSDPALTATVRRQLELGLQVRALVFGDLSPYLRNAYRDFVVFDRRLYYQVQAPPQLGATPGPGSVVETRLSMRGADVSSSVQRFDELWALARELT